MKKSNLLSHAAAALLVTILSGLIYVSVQQSHRSGANDPQLQIARDISGRLKNNKAIDQLMAGDTVEISKSLAVFIVLYDMNGEPIRSNGLLDGKLPQIPKGVFDFTRRHGEDAISWQPRRGVRMATVVESVQAGEIGFVAVGRSLQEVEKRVGSLTTMILIGWLACIGVIFLHVIIVNIRSKHKTQ